MSRIVSFGYPKLSPYPSTPPSPSSGPSSLASLPQICLVSYVIPPSRLARRAQRDRQALSESSPHPPPIPTRAFHVKHRRIIPANPRERERERIRHAPGLSPPLRFAPSRPLRARCARPAPRRSQTAMGRVASRAAEMTPTSYSHVSRETHESAPLLARTRPRLCRLPA